MIKAYRIQSNKVIEPLGDRPLDCPIFDKTLAEHQAAALQELGLQLETVADWSEIQDNHEHIIFTDYLYFMPRLLQEFVSRSQALQSNTVCALKPGLTTLRTVTPTQTVKHYDDRIEYQLYYVPATAQRGPVQPVIIETDHFLVPMPVPPHMFGDTHYCFPMTDKLLVQVEHWTNLWMANLGRILLTGAKMSQLSGTQLLKLVIKWRSINRWTLLRQANRIGKNCDIHPTAYLECAVIGDNVTIGAGAVVRSVYIGDGSYIGNNAVVELSVLGERCNVMNNCTMQMSLAFSGLFSMAKLISASVCGRDTFIGDGVTLTDFRLDDKPIAVLHDDTKVNTLNPVVGSCLGHGVYLGAGAIVAPGRAVPNDLRVAVHAERAIRMNGEKAEIPGYQVVDAFRKMHQLVE